MEQFEFPEFQIIFDYSLLIQCKFIMSKKYKIYKTNIYLSDEQDSILKKAKEGRKSGYGQLLVEAFFKRKTQINHEERKQKLRDLMVASELESELRALLEYYIEGQDIKDDLEAVISRVKNITEVLNQDPQ